MWSLDQTNGVVTGSLKGKTGNQLMKLYSGMLHSALNFILSVIDA